MIICDWPEVCTFSLTFKSTNSNYPCHFCLVQKDNLDKLPNLGDNQIILRNHENMSLNFNNNTAASVSLEQIENYFWKIP